MVDEHLVDELFAASEPEMPVFNLSDPVQTVGAEGRIAFGSFSHVGASNDYTVVLREFPSFSFDRRSWQFYVQWVLSCEAGEQEDIIYPDWIIIEMTDSRRMGTGLRTIRKRRLERGIERWNRKLQQVKDFERRFVWYRLASLILVGAATWLSASWFPAFSGRVFLISLGVFLVVVGLHRRLDASIDRLSIWIGLRRTQLARMNLDWDQLPPPLALPFPRTSLDIDLDITGPRSLHQLVDLSVSSEGSQRLAGWLTDPTPDLIQIGERQAVVRELSEMPRFRDRLLLNLHLVSREELKGSRLIKWLSVAYQDKALGWSLLAGSLLAILNGFLFALHSLDLTPPLWPYTWVLYAAFYFANANRLEEFLNSVVDLDRELDKFRSLLHQLEEYPIENHPALASLCAPFRDPDHLPSWEIRRIKWVTSMVGLRANPFFGFIINLLVPWDFFFAFLAGRMRKRASTYLPKWLDTWYQLDALLSLGNLAYLNPDFAFPEISPNTLPVFQAKDLGHPLIPPSQKVCNEYTQQELGQVVIITGSNMAGKSTFIRTVGVNLCLAYAGGPVNASNLHTGAFRLYTCMRVTDSLNDGFSYFYNEVKNLKALLKMLRDDHPLPVFYLIDEIYRGTNNRERLIGSRAYIHALVGARGTGLIATHDLELAGLAQQFPQVYNFHFRDAVEERRLVFDYKIHPGPSPTTNALKIMEIEGLPVEE